MKELKFKQLVAYATAFVSFVLPKIPIVKEIILFGSAARGEAEKESDIYLFFDVDNKKDETEIRKIIEEELKKFYKSKIAEIWFLKGIKNPISIKTGKLDEWKLKRSIISGGISLYSDYKEIPKNMKAFVFFNVEPVKDIAKRNRLIRILFGRKEKNYSTNGILEEINGKRLSASSFIIPKQFTERILNLLKKERVNYRFFEFWTDSII